PNSELITKNVRNFTHASPLGRVQIDVRVKFATDPEHVRTVLKACAADHPEVLARPEPNPVLAGFADNGVNFTLYCFVKSPRLVPRTRSDLYYELVKRFHAEGVEFVAP